MTMCELATIAQENIKINVAIINNGYLGMVRQWQEFFYDRRYSHSYMDALPDFVQLAESFGHTGVCIEKPSEVEDGLREMFSRKDQLVFMDFITDQTENVYPMIAAGAGHNEMHLQPSNDGKTPQAREVA